jgi:hypothetical protein
MDQTFGNRVSVRMGRYCLTLIRPCPSTHVYAGPFLTSAGTAAQFVTQGPVVQHISLDLLTVQVPDADPIHDAVNDGRRVHPCGAGEDLDPKALRNIGDGIHWRSPKNEATLNTAAQITFNSHNAIKSVRTE